MKRYFILLIIFCFCCFMMTRIPLVFAMEDAIIAVVNDELITLKDLKDYMHSVVTQLKMEGGHTPAQIQEIMKQVKKNALDRLIDDRIVLDAANERGFEAKRDAVDEEIKKFKDRYSSEQDFIDGLALEGLTISDLRKKISNQLKAQYFVDHEIKSQIQIKPQEVTDYYHANTDKFKTPETVDLDSVFIPFKDDRTTAEQQVQEAYLLLTEGRPFDEVAQRFSSPPSIGTIARGQLKPAIEQQVFSLEVGQMTRPISTEEGFFIFKLKTKKSSRPVSLEESKDYVAQLLFNQKFKEKMKTWLDEQKADSFIEIKNP